MSIQDLAYRFKSHPMTEKNVRNSDKLRQEFISIADMIELYCSDSRETSLCLTKLEEALFWANADLARNGGYNATH